MIHLALEFSCKISEIAAELPRLPSAIRYYDDFDDKHHSIRDPENSNIWEIQYDGERVRLDFSVLMMIYDLSSSTPLQIYFPDWSRPVWQTSAVAFFEAMIRLSTLFNHWFCAPKSSEISG